MPDSKKYTAKLAGKHVLVIGGSAGIGYSVAEASLEFGAKVTISSSNRSRVDDAVKKLKSAYPSAESNVVGHIANLGDAANLEQNITSLLETVVRGFGKIDHLIFTAADSLAVMKLDEITLDKIHQAGLIRFFAPMLVVKHARQHMNAGPQSSITLTTGGVSERPIPGWSVINGYATGLQGLTRGFALDVAPIRVNCVSPGLVDTPLWKDMPEEQKQGMFKHIREVLPTQTIATPEMVAEAYLYLMRDDNITGSMISTNGGHLLVGPR